MKNIVIICAKGFSSSLLVNKMKASASAMHYKCAINAYDVCDVQIAGATADVILLGPQIRYTIDKVKEQCPYCPIDTIDMHTYGMMDGHKVLMMAVDLMENR